MNTISLKLAHLPQVCVHKWPNLPNHFLYLVVVVVVVLKKSIFEKQKGASRKCTPSRAG